VSAEPFGGPVTKANQGVWALVSGFAPLKKRRGRLLLVFQAYIDDSFESGDALILAGFVASAEKWAAFSDEWQEIVDMRMPYPIKSYHAAKHGNSDEEREREMFFYRVIERHVMGGINFCVSTFAINHACDLYGADAYHRNPYNFAFAGFVSMIDSALGVLGIAEPIDLIFDERGEAGHVIEGLEMRKKLIPDGQVNWLRSPPSFKSDEDVLPLQAADMLAYYTLQKFRRTGRIDGDDGLWPWKPKSPILLSTFQPRKSGIKQVIKLAVESDKRNGLY
jgi:hypothetical protein